MEKTFDLDGLTVTATFEPDQYGRPMVVELHLSGRSITTDDIRRIPIVQWKTELVTERPVEPITRRTGESTDKFSARVASAYIAVAAFSPRPAALLAEASGVPLPTVHTWIREARLRGLLPASGRRNGA